MFLSKRDIFDSFLKKVVLEKTISMEMALLRTFGCNLQYLNGLNFS